MILTVVIFAFILVVVYLLPGWVALRIGGPTEGKMLVKHLLVAATGFIILLLLLNSFMPFAGGGDDEDYYYVSLLPIQLSTSLFTLFESEFGQPGYPILLSVLNVIVGDNLLARKAVNLSFFLLTALCWYRIGFVVGDKRTAKQFFVAVLLSSPVWYYFFFLLKDMTITLLTSLFVLSVFRFYKERSGIVLMIMSSLVVSLFRFPLIAFNIAFLAITVVLLSERKYRIYKYMAAALIVFILLRYGTDTGVLGAMGISPERNISAAGIRTQVESYTLTSTNASIPYMILLYLLSETTAFRMFGFESALSIEGMAALPWIFVGFPLFLAACYGVLRYRKGIESYSTRLIACLFVLVAGYLVVSLIVHDTTRWRIPGFPGMAAIAALGWQYLGKKRTLYMTSTALVGGIVIFTYYYLRG